MTSSRTNIDNEIIPSFRTTLGVMYVTLKKEHFIAALFTLAKAWKQCKQFPGSSGQNLTLLLPRIPGSMSGQATKIPQALQWWPRKETI